MQTINSVSEVDQSSPSRMLESLSPTSKSPVRVKQERKSTLSIITLRAPNNKLNVNWSIIPQNASKKHFQELINSLEKKLNESIDQPIELLEDKLFFLCSVYHNELRGDLSTPEIIELFHLVNVIQEENTKSIQIANALAELGQVSPEYLKGYDFLCNFLKLINDLALIYGVVNLHDYRFRFDPKIESAKIINLPGIFSDIINMEVMWLSFAVQRPPLMHVMNQEIKDLSKLLQEEFYKMLFLFMESNKYNLENKEKIQSYLASKNPKLVQDYGFRVEGKSANKPVYQTLSQKVCNCFRFRTGFRAAELKQQLFEFEQIYQHFEGAVLKSWYELYNN